ncbi:MAG: transglycosylase SLT domain-containing protein [Candidatus Binatia bacterium]|nr:transglycosylase SLT domain-containing protein [Candidatus Binatia bacterium]
MDAGRTTAARRAFERTVVVVPELADHGLYWAGHLAAQNGDTAGAVRNLDTLLRDHHRSVWVSSAATERGEIELKRRNPKQALRYFDTAIRAWESKSRSRAMLGKARALEALGRPREAYSLTLELAGRPGDVGRAATVVREGLEAKGPKVLGMSSAQFSEKVASARLKEGRPDAALAALGKASSGKALLLRARILKSAGRSREATAAYGKAAASGDPDAAAQALAERARIEWNADRNEAAARDFRRLAERFPRHAQAPEALYALGRIDEARGAASEAARHYETIAGRYPNSKVAEESAWRAGFVRYRNGDAAGAAAAWRRISGRDDALYWSGRALAAAGRSDDAKAAYARLGARSPRSYYTWWLGVPERFDNGAGPSPRPVSAATVPTAARNHLERARLLRDLGFRDDAMRELAGARNAAGPSALLLREYESLGAHRQVIRLAARLRSQGVSGLDQKLRPLAHWPAFQKAGRKYGIDPLLLASIARQESMFDERIASPADAQGVMQLLPSTASAMTGRTMKRWELWDPEVNIDLGARYFRKMLDRFDGRAIPAIAAYNAGPRPANRWLDQNGRLRGDEFVELISYRETRGYVKKVLENYRIYRGLYGKPGVTPVRLF